VLTTYPTVGDLSDRVIRSSSRQFQEESGDRVQAARVDDAVMGWIIVALQV
jgi:hypothetical protein